MHVARTFSATIIIVIALSLFAPLLARAQAPQSDLRATIRAELLADPRTAGLSQAELNAMVELLVGEAQKKGVTAGDIIWRPAEENFSSPVQKASECGTSWLCHASEAFGFAGSDPSIALWLGFAAMALITVVGLMLHHHRHGVHAV